MCCLRGWVFFSIFLSFPFAPTALAYDDYHSLKNDFVHAQLPSLSELPRNESWTGICNETSDDAYPRSAILHFFQEGTGGAEPTVRFALYRGAEDVPDRFQKVGTDELEKNRHELQRTQLNYASPLKTYYPRYDHNHYHGSLRSELHAPPHTAPFFETMTLKEDNGWDRIYRLRVRHVSNGPPVFYLAETCDYKNGCGDGKEDYHRVVFYCRFDRSGFAEKADVSSENSGAKDPVTPVVPRPGPTPTPSVPPVKKPSFSPNQPPEPSVPTGGSIRVTPDDGKLG